MLKQEIIFGAGELITPDLAARIAQCAAMFQADVYIRHRDIELCVDSLIGILAMNIRAGSAITIGAEGSDAQAAVTAVCELLKG